MYSKWLSLNCPKTSKTTMSTLQKTPKLAKYPSDISQNGCKNLKKVLPARLYDFQKGGQPASDGKAIINAIFYVVKTGCSWRSMPHDLPHWSTAYGYFRRWSQDGTWQRRATMDS
jgi:putative transposase